MSININEKIQLEAITFDNQPKLIALIQRIYPPVYKHLWKNEDSSFYINKFYNPKQLQEELLEQEAYYYFVVYKKKTAGIFRIQFNKHLNDNKKSAYINRIYLGSEAQGKGVAKALFDWIEIIAEEKKYTSLWLKVMNTQDQAIKFYTKQGYKISDTTSLDFDLLNKPLRGMYIMTKDL